jgi:ABC-2 type transport system ATP-binding protein
MILKVNDLTVQFKNGLKGIQDMSFCIGNGIYGLLGENGAGKTTLMRVLTTVIKPTAGNLMFDSIPYAEKNYEIIQKKIGYLPQELNLYPNLTVEETLMYLGTMAGIDRDVCEKRIHYYLKRTGLYEYKGRKNKQLSGGMKRRVGLVQALLNEPQLLIVDEPTTGLDPEERVRIRKLLVDFSMERTVLFSTHVVEDLAATTDHILIMKKGQLKYAGQASQLISETKGKLWTYSTKNQEDSKWIESNFHVTAKQLTADGIRFKILCEQRPLEGAVPAEVTLEDAYIHINHKADDCNKGL